MEDVTKSVNQHDTKISTVVTHYFRNLMEYVTKSATPNPADRRGVLTEFNAWRDEVSKILAIILVGIPWSIQGDHLQPHLVPSAIFLNGSSPAREHLAQ